MAAFVDILAFEQATLLIAAVVLVYVGIIGLLAIRRNDPSGLKSVLRGGAVPLASVGAIATALGVWGEMAWPYPTGLTVYNIFFTDVYLLFGITLVVVAISMALSLKLQFADLFAAVAGAVTIGYGWNGYQLGLTKDPLETFLLYGSFGLAALVAFPATVLVDHYLTHADGTKAVFGTGVSLAFRTPSIQASTRAAGPVVPSVGVSSAESTDFPLRFRLPYYVPIIVLVFVVAMSLAAFAAFGYLNSTVPGHLASPP